MSSCESQSLAIPEVSPGDDCTLSGLPFQVNLHGRIPNCFQGIRFRDGTPAARNRFAGLCLAHRPYEAIGRTDVEVEMDPLWTRLMALHNFAEPKTAFDNPF